LEVLLIAFPDGEQVIISIEASTRLFLHVYTFQLLKLPSPVTPLFSGMITPISFPRHGLCSTKDLFITYTFRRHLSNHSASFHMFVLCLLSVRYINLRVLLGVSPVRTHLNTSSSPSNLSSRLQHPSRRSTPFSPDRIPTNYCNMQGP